MKVSGLLIAFAVGGPLGAQDRSLVELGASAVRFRVDSLESVGPSARWLRLRERGAHALLVGIGGVVGLDGASGSVEVTGRTFVPLGSRLRAEFEAEGSALGSSGTASPATVATSAVLNARLSRSHGERGAAWFGGRGSLSARRPHLLAGAGVSGGSSWRIGDATIAGSIERAWSVAQLFTGPGRLGFVGTVPVAYTEATARGSHAGERASIEASATMRRDPGAEHLVEWGSSIDASFRQTPTRALFVSLASQLPDFVHGADAARSVTVGVRLFDAAPRTTARERRARPVVQVSGDSTNRTLHVRAPGARSVEVMGDFTEWLPVLLVGTGGVFSTAASMPAGNRRLVVRIDGGPWVPPSNTPVVDDDFGGRVGLVLVP
ncbi:MAG: glycogen-binding domain-containing protein [Gemmatimonadaceae bacterium]